MAVAQDTLESEKGRRKLITHTTHTNKQVNMMFDLKIFESLRALALSWRPPLRIG